MVTDDPAMPDLQFAPPHAITDPGLAEQGFTARAKVAGGHKKNNKQRLDPSRCRPHHGLALADLARIYGSEASNTFFCSRKGMLS